MIVEWECTLNCNYRCYYCGNGRNDMLPCVIPHEPDKEKIFRFLDGILDEFPESELFVFGGEPFLHPFIGEIIAYMNEIKLQYIIQTNFSQPEIIKSILEKEDFTIQVSLHRMQIQDIMGLYNSIRELQHIIKRIDIMFDGAGCLPLYGEVLRVLDDKKKLYMAPIADFNLDGVCNQHLYEFNRLKKGVYGKVYQFESGNRSYVWEEQMRGNISYKGKTCLYKNRYVLFDPSLKRYKCNYRQNNEICPNDQCFLM
jgi:organic radical activating enzyme